jgi:hypothetical protein
VFPTEFETITYLIGWYSLKAYTKMNMYVKKIKYHFFPITDTVNIHFVSNGEEVLQLSNKDSDLSLITAYDFIFYEIEKENEPAYVVIKDKVTNESEINLEDIEKSNARFLAPHLLIDNSQMLIEFTKNFYVVNNILFSRPFITWYMKTFNDYSIDNKDYSIQFFDNNMDFIEISSDQCVILGKDKYEIGNYVKEEASEAASEACACEADACEAASEVEACACEVEVEAEADAWVTDEEIDGEIDEETDGEDEDDEEIEEELDYEEEEAQSASEAASEAQSASEAASEAQSASEAASEAQSASEAVAQSASETAAAAQEAQEAASASEATSEAASEAQEKAKIE